MVGIIGKCLSDHRAGLAPGVGPVNYAYDTRDDFTVASERQMGVVEIISGVPDIVPRSYNRPGAGDLVGTTGEALVANILTGPLRRQRRRAQTGLDKNQNATNQDCESIAHEKSSFRTYIGIEALRHLP